MGRINGREVDTSVDPNEVVGYVSHLTNPETLRSFRDLCNQRLSDLGAPATVEPVPLGVAKPPQAVKAAPGVPESVQKAADALPALDPANAAQAAAAGSQPAKPVDPPEPVKPAEPVKPEGHAKPTGHANHGHVKHDKPDKHAKPA